MQIQTTPKPINYTLLWIAAIIAGTIGGMFVGPFLLGTALKPQFLNNNKQVISYHAVDSIVQAAYTSYL